jgi:hypothetical protein
MKHVKIYENFTKGYYYKIRTDDPIVLCLTLKKLGFDDPELNNLKVPKRLEYLLNAGKKGCFFIVEQEGKWFSNHKDLMYYMNFKNPLDNKGEIKISKNEIELAKSMKKYNL